MKKPKNERQEIVGFRVKRSDVRPVNELVRKFLKLKGYRFYGARKRKTKIKTI